MLPLRIQALYALADTNQPMDDSNNVTRDVLFEADRFYDDLTAKVRDLKGGHNIDMSTYDFLCIRIARILFTKVDTDEEDNFWRSKFVDLFNMCHFSNDHVVSTEHWIKLNKCYTAVRQSLEQLFPPIDDVDMVEIALLFADLVGVIRKTLKQYESLNLSEIDKKLELASFFQRDIDKLDIINMWAYKNTIEISF